GVRKLPCGKFLAASLRENSGIYVLASLSNAFLIISQYLAVSAAVASYLPVDSATAVLVASYGRGLGIGLALFLNSLVFQGILAVLVALLALASIVNTEWKWAYAFSGVVVSGFVGYWLGGKIPGYSGMDLHPPRQPGRQLKPVRGSLLVWPGSDHMLSGDDSRSEKILRKTRRKIFCGQRTHKFKLISSHRAVKTQSPSISGSRAQPRIRTQNRSEQTPINNLGRESHMMPSSRSHDPASAPVENG